MKTIFELIDAPIGMVLVVAGVIGLFFCIKVYIQGNPNNSLKWAASSAALALVGLIVLAFTQMPLRVPPTLLSERDPKADRIYIAVSPEFITYADSALQIEWYGEFPHPDTLPCGGKVTRAFLPDRTLTIENSDKWEKYIPTNLQVAQSAMYNGGQIKLGLVNSSVENWDCWNRGDGTYWIRFETLLAVRR